MGRAFSSLLVGCRQDLTNIICRFFYSAGGVCSGRTPSHGYWCSANNPRAEVGQHNIDPPGGFFYGDVLPQAAKFVSMSWE